jgi:ABC-type sugar transport system substrate-binding protein
VRRLGMKTVVLLAALAGAGSLAACSSSSSSPGTASSAASAGTAGTTASTAACTAKAEQEVSKLSAPVSLSLPPIGKSLSALDLKGKTVAYVGDTSVAVLEDEYEGLRTAAQYLGFSVHLYNDSGTIPGTDAAISEAISANSSVIISSSTPLADIAPEIVKAKAAHIPVVSIYETPATPADNVAYTVSMSGTVAGDNVGWYMLAQDHCNVNDAAILTNSATTSVQMANSISAVFAAECPATCHVKEIPETITQDQTSFTTTTVVAAVEADPSINYISSVGAGDASYIVQALKTLGKVGKIGVATNAGVPFTTTAITQSGSGLSALADPLAFPLHGWFLADAALRVLAGQTGTEAIPQRLVINSSPSAAAPFEQDSYYTNYFEKLWTSGS